MKVKCPWCGRQVDTLKGRLRNHVVQKGVQCHGIFDLQSVAQIQAANPAPPPPQRKKR